MLYKTIELSYPTETNKFILPSGVLGYFPVTLEAGKALTFSMNHLILDPLHLPQDFSMRGWFSRKVPGGVSVIYTPESLSRWHLTALQKRIIQLYDSSSNIEPTQPSSIGLLPGEYWLNILNLVNETNFFALNIASN